MVKRWTSDPELSWGSVLGPLLFSSSVHGWWGLVTQSCLTLATPWTVAHQAPLSMGFSRQEYRTGLPFPSPQYPGVSFISRDLNVIFMQWLLNMSLRVVLQFSCLLGTILTLTFTPQSHIKRPPRTRHCPAQWDGEERERPYWHTAYILLE